MHAYLANGPRLAVLIDPQRRTVEICAPGADPRMLDSAESVPLEPVLQGFSLHLGPIFL